MNDKLGASALRECRLVPLATTFLVGKLFHKFVSEKRKCIVTWNLKV
jgi:hypothetical protein